MALTKPNRKRVEKRSPKNKKAPSVTNIGAAFAKSVELATDVRLIDQCQTARSQEKKRPARINKKYSPFVEGFFRCPLAGLDKDIQTQRTGSAKVIR